MLVCMFELGFRPYKKLITRDRDITIDEWIQLSQSWESQNKIYLDIVGDWDFQNTMKGIVMLLVKSSDG